jgi:DNA topoisomerase I
MNQYCYDVSEYEGDDFSGLERFIEKLYSKGKYGYTKDEKPPIIVTHVAVDNSVCVKIQSSAKKHKTKIDDIHSHLKSKDLVFDGASIGKPILTELEQCKWWEKGCVLNQTKKWESLSHNGPYLPSVKVEYQPHHVPLRYDGKKVKLEPEEEKVATFYAQRIYAEKYGNVALKFVGDPTFDANYFADFRTYLTPEHKQLIRDFSKVNFDDIVEYLRQKKETKESDEQKKIKKKAAEKNKNNHGFAMVNGVKEKVANFTVEPAAIFYGRGVQKNRGKIKKDVQPEDVTINIDLNAPVPELPEGRKWGKVTHDDTVEWLAKWIENIGGKNKYTRLDNEGQMKGQNDFFKYEKARKLNTYLDLVRRKYESDITSNDQKLAQLSTVIYFIDRHGIRVGTEEGGDTVGASTLLVGNINLDTPDRVVFDFLGKDSIRYYKEIDVSNDIYTNLKRFVKGKKEDALLFDKITASDINRYLKTFDKSFSAKVFRTRLASSLMHAELPSKVPKNATEKDKEKLVHDANVKVAQLLNHKRSVSLAAKEDIGKLEAQIKELEKEKRRLKKEGKSLTRVEHSIETKKDQVSRKSSTQDIALGTSRQNYIDPRVLISWSKKHDLPLAKIYTKTLLAKFQWAQDKTDKDWDYVKTPLFDQLAGLEPLAEGEKLSGKRKTGKRKKKSPAKQPPPPARKPATQIEKSKPAKRKEHVSSEKESPLPKIKTAKTTQKEAQIELPPKVHVAKPLIKRPVPKLTAKEQPRYAESRLRLEQAMKELKKPKKGLAPLKRKPSAAPASSPKLQGPKHQVVHLETKISRRLAPVLVPEGGEEYLVEVYGLKLGKHYIIYGTGADALAISLKRLGGRRVSLKTGPAKEAWIFSLEDRKKVVEYLLDKEVAVFAGVLSCAKRESAKSGILVSDVLRMVQSEVPFVNRYLTQKSFSNRINTNYKKSRRKSL